MITKTLIPTTREEQRQAQTPEGMRELIKAHALHNPIIHRAMRMQQHMSLSELDLMTVIAFEAITRGEACERVALEYALRAQGRGEVKL